MRSWFVGWRAHKTAVPSFSRDALQPCRVSGGTAFVLPGLVLVGSQPGTECPPALCPSGVGGLSRAIIGFMFCPQAVDWEGVRLWVQTLATFAGVVVTLSGFAWVLRRHYSDKRVAQAERVYAWIHSDDDGGYELRVGNGSNLPVYNVFLYYMVTPDRPTPKTWEEIEAVFSERFTTAADLASTGNFVPAVKVLPPGDFRVLTALEGMRGGRTDFSHLFAVDVVFTDASGRHWTRRATGELQRSKESPAQSERVQAVFGLIGMASSPYRRIQPVD